MTNPIDVETVPNQAIAIRPSMSVGQAMGVQDILAQVHLIQEVMGKVMKEGEHYGSIPGCGPKKTLLLPGAQKLTMTFRLTSEYSVQEVNLERGHKEYRITCTLKSMGSGGFVGQGVGCCSTMESKYRFRGGAIVCPECGKQTVIKGKKDFGGGWLCWTKKGGCGFKWPDGAQEIEGQNVEKVENENPADCYNTVLKIAKKRAFVDATITATAASDIFTQDIGEDEIEAQTSTAEYIPPQEPDPPKPSPRASAPEKADPAMRMRALNQLQAAPGQPNRDSVTLYLRAMGLIEDADPEGQPEKWRLDKIPTTLRGLKELYAKIAQWEADRHAPAEGVTP